MSSYELRKLNLEVKNKAKLKIDADSIPNLVPKKILEEWIGEETEPYFKIQAINYPIIANGINYKESFFEEFISKLKDRPIPGSKNGHHMAWGIRPPTDFVMVGAKIEKKGNGKGTIFFKNFIPAQGEAGDNSIFIRENKSDMVHYSRVSYTKDEIERDENGNVTINVVGSIKGERNDAVEYGMGAMEQKTNVVGQKIRRASVTKCKSLITQDKLDQTSSWSFSAADENKLLGADGEDWNNFASWHMVENTNAEENTKARYKYPYGKNGKVYRSALRAIASRAGQQGFSELSDLASSLIKSIDEKENIVVDDDKKLNIGVIMDKEELLKKLNTYKTNGEITLLEVAEFMGLENQIITDEHKKALKLSNSFKKMNIENPIEEFQKLKKQTEDNKKSVFSAKMTENFGAEKRENGENNLLRVYAEQKLSGVKTNNLDTEIKNLKENDLIAKKLAAENADYMSEANRIAEVEHQEKKTNSTEKKVDKV